MLIGLLIFAGLCVALVLGLRFYLTQNLYIKPKRGDDLIAILFDIDFPGYSQITILSILRSQCGSFLLPNTNCDSGCKNIVSADCSWSSEEYLVFGVNEYPDIEAEQKHAIVLIDMNLFRYADSKVILGTPNQNKANSNLKQAGLTDRKR